MKHINNASVYIWAVDVAEIHQSQQTEEDTDSFWNCQDLFNEPCSQVIYLLISQATA